MRVTATVGGVVLPLPHGYPGAGMPLPRMGETLSVYGIEDRDRCMLLFGTAEFHVMDVVHRIGRDEIWLELAGIPPAQPGAGG